MDEVRLEGFHALKHALRFGAEIRSASGDPGDLPERLAPDVAHRMRALLTGSGDLVATAVRPLQEIADDGVVVLLENPRHLGNLGACVRVAAAAGAAGVLTTGDRDPWHPDAIRGSAGLHFALPVLHCPVPGRRSFMKGRRPGTGQRPLVAVDPEGEEVQTVPADAVLAFGSERHGLSDELLARADVRARLPMRPGVSSLNLATAVAAALYGWGLTRTSTEPT